MNFDHQQDDTAAFARLLGGLGSLVGLVLMVVLFLYGCAKGGEVAIEWDANRPEDRVVEYRVYLLTETQTLLARAVIPEAKIAAQEGDVIAVAAWNGCESALSEPITVPGPIRLVIQRSADLRVWTDLQTIEVERKPAEFFRIQVQP